MSERNDDSRTRYEEFAVSGGELLDKVKGLLREGNVRRIFIKNADGDVLLEIPLTAGVAVTAIAAAVSPVLVAVGAIAALLTQGTIGVERQTDATDHVPETPVDGPEDPTAGP